MTSRGQCTASSAFKPGNPARRISLASLATIIFIKRWLSPCSIARLTRLMGRLSKSALRPARFTFWSVIPTRPRKVVWVSGPIAKACCRTAAPRGSDEKGGKLISRNDKVTCVALDDVLIFVKVAQFESITRAARSLGMPISTVSRRLSVLESELGVSLLRRTTRRVTLTPQGRDYFSQCQEPLSLLEQAEQALTRAQKRPEGLLRITIPVVLSQEPFLNFMSAFMKEHVGIRVELVVTNLLLDLI